MPVITLLSKGQRIWIKIGIGGVEILSNYIYFICFWEKIEVKSSGTNFHINILESRLVIFSFEIVFLSISQKAFLKKKKSFMKKCCLHR